MFLLTSWTRNLVKYHRLLASIGALLFFSQQSAAGIIFEGYYRISIAEAPVGYIIQRIEFDEKAKVMRATSLTKTLKSMGNITESIVATATDKLAPLTVQYTLVDQGKQMTIDGRVSQSKMGKVKHSIFEATINKGGQAQRVKEKVEKGVFFSSFLPYLMLNTGVKTHTRFQYKAIAEETGKIQTGESYIGRELVDYKGYKVFKITNKYAGSTFVSYMAPNADIFYTYSPSNKLTARLVSKNEALIGMPYPQAVIKRLFGNLPEGTKHTFKLKNTLPSTTQALPPGTGLNPAKSEQWKKAPDAKGGAVTPGQGVIIKKPPEKGK